MVTNIDLANFSTNQGSKIFGAAILDESGFSVTLAGDVNGDGYSDVIIGAPGARPNSKPAAGTSYVIFGKNNGFADIDLANLTSSQGFKILGANASYSSGHSVASAGDINKDGYDDIIIGTSSQYDVPYPVYVVFGKSSFSDIDLASLMSSQGFIIFGVVGDGTSVSSAGDVNGDGYTEIIIGNGDGNFGAGVSYVIFGKYGAFSDIDLANLTISQGFKILGAESNDGSGCSVASAGDVNRDGYSDIIIGAWTASSNSKLDAAGTSYVIFGKASGFSDIDLADDLVSLGQGFKIFGAAEFDYSGTSVNTAGDINRDGYDDLIIGAPEASPNSKLDAGTSYVIFGKASGFIDIDLASLTSSQGFKILGAASYDYSGRSVASAGDINGDGYSDIIIGAYYADPLSRNNAGTTYIIYGTSTYNTLSPSAIPTLVPTLYNTLSPSAIPTSIPTFYSLEINLDELNNNQGFSAKGYYDSIGYSVAEAGDVNGDGYNDIIIGGPSLANNAGISYILFGFNETYGFSNLDLTNLNITQGFSIEGEKPGDNSGHSVNGAGDINNDGYADFIIGAPGTLSNTGVTYVVFGNKNLANLNLTNLSLNYKGFSIIGARQGDKSGYSVSGIGDINNDNYSDIIIGAYGANSFAGISYVIFGKGGNFVDIYLDDLLVEQGFSIIGSEINDNSGYSVSGAGDINGDGYDDVIIGSPGAKNNTGISYAIFGHSNNFSNIALANLSSSQGFVIAGVNNGDKAGYSVSSAGDWNNDGYDDFIIGAPYTSYNDMPDVGFCYLLFGKNNFTNILLDEINIYGASIIGAGKNYLSCSSVGLAGNVNGDKYSDVIIGAPGANSNAGASYVVYGQANALKELILSELSATQGYSAIGGSPLEKTGRSVSGVGDINSDGLSDVAIGASVGSYIIINPRVGTPTLSPTPQPNEETSIWSELMLNVVIKLISAVIASIISGSAVYFYRQCRETSNNIKISEELSTSIIKKFKEKLSCSMDYDQQVELHNQLAEALRLPVNKPILHAINNYTPKDNRNDIKNRLISDLAEKLIISNLVFSNNNHIEYNLKSSISLKTIVDVTIKEIDLDYNFLEAKSCISWYNNDRFKMKESEMITNPVNTEVIQQTTQDKLVHKDEESNIDSTSQQNIERNDNVKNPVLLSIDAMMDPEHVRLQNVEFVRFSNQLVNFVYAEFPNDINWLISSKSDNKPLFLANHAEDSQIVAIYEGPPPADDTQFFSSNNLMPPLLNTKQILYNSPLFHYLSQSSINYLGYNVTLPDPLDNKELLISADLVLGNLAAQYLPEQSIMNGMLISTLSTVGYATRLIVVDYLKNQEPSDDPIEFSMQCLSTIAAYALPGMVNYALTKTILPDAKMSISTLDMLSSSSFGVVQCYNNYKTVYAAETQPTTTDIVPYIADAVMLWSLRGHLNFDASNTANLMMSIKSTMSVAATTYAAHCVSSMVMDMAPQKLKEGYIEAVCDYISDATVCAIDNINQMIGEAQNYFG